MTCFDVKLWLELLNEHYALLAWKPARLSTNFLSYRHVGPISGAVPMNEG